MTDKEKDLLRYLIINPYVLNYHLIYSCLKDVSDVLFSFVICLHN